MFVALALLCLAFEPPQNHREGLAPLNDLIGHWKGSGSPHLNNAAERRKGSWSETQSWSWNLKGEPRLVLEIKDGKLFKAGVLRYLPEGKKFELTLTCVNDEKKTFVGQREENQLVLLRTDGQAAEDEKMVLQWLHGSRLLYRLETKEKSARSFTRRFQVGATKEGSDFAKSSVGTECVVTGGAASIPVTYQGKTYYVCCTGCKEAFEENPAQILKEYAERKAKEAKEKKR